MDAGPPLHDLEARARWHLELQDRYPEPAPMTEAQRRAHEDAEFDGAYMGAVTCWDCGGECIDITCVDDLCHGIGYCMHGDGQRPCPQCYGEGVL